MRKGIVIILLAMGVWAGAAVELWAGVAVAAVLPTVETERVRGTGDKADDIAIWVHPVDASLSTIIGVSKAESGGLHVFNLDGQEIQFVGIGRINNVDVRCDFPLAGGLVDLVAAGNRTDNSIVVYKVDPVSGELEDVAAGSLYTGTGVYGSCMYHSSITGKYYFIVNSLKGEVEQWELYDDGSGKVAAMLVRSFEVGGKTDGCVADDEYGVLYIAQEGKGIWRYPAEPTDGTSGRLTDKTGTGGHLVADVEGLTIYYGERGTGYLIASSQGNATFVIYDRQADNEYIGTFEVVGNPGLGIDGCSETDGIDVAGAYLGPSFPNGLFVAHDNRNSGGSSSNYKLVPWESIALSVGPGLSIYTGGSQEYELSVDVAAGGSVELEPDGGIYGVGMMVKLTAIPEEGFRLKSWSGTADDRSTSTVNYVRVNSNQTVGIEYEAKPDIPAEIFDITKCKITAGKDRGWPLDSIAMSGSLFDGFSTGIEGAQAIRIRIYNLEDENPVYLEDVPFDYGDMAGGRFSYEDTSGRFFLFKFDLNENSFFLTVRNADLTGLSSPVILEMEAGDYLGMAVAGESVEEYLSTGIGPGAAGHDVINGSKRIPIQLLWGYADRMRIDKGWFEFHKETREEICGQAEYFRKNGSLSIAGELSLQARIDMSDPNFQLSFGSEFLSFEVGAFEEVIEPDSVPGEYKTVTHQVIVSKQDKEIYTIKKHKLDPDVIVYDNGGDEFGKLENFGPIVDAVFDFEKGTFKIDVKYADIEAWDVEPDDEFEFRLTMTRISGELGDFEGKADYVYRGKSKDSRKYAWDGQCD
jgi:3-phytase